MARYTNLDGRVPDKTLADILRWKVGGAFAKGGARTTPGYRTPRVEPSIERIASSLPHLTWVGHASYLLRLGGRLIATDPVFSNFVGPIRRTLPAGLPKGEIPPLDIVTISHAHFDHLDIPTLKRIGPSPTYVTPKGNGELLRSIGLPNVVELEWWGAVTLGTVTITLTPAQHWSMRMPWARNSRLWGGFIYESAEGTAYHSGDTAWSEPLFASIGERFPKIDWAMMPIGAYAPEWFMGEQHINPEDAGRAWATMRASYFCAMHWGTFVLSDEPLDEPPARIRAWWKKGGYDPEKLLVFDVGETKLLARR